MNKLLTIALGLSLSITACQPSAKSSHDGHDHGAEIAEEAHEEHNNQELTIFTEETELFTEFHPLVAGQVSNFLAHLTRLNTYKPYNTGKPRRELFEA